MSSGGKVGAISLCVLSPSCASASVRRVVMSLMTRKKKNIEQWGNTQFDNR